MTDRERILEALCDHFDDEWERQEGVLRLCVAQGEAARARDLGSLEHHTAALSVLIQEAIDAERKRLELVQEVVAAYDLPAEAQTLSHLVEIAPEPWRTRMEEFQHGVRATLEETRRVVRSNNAVLRRGLSVANGALAAIGVGMSNSNYDARGEGAGRLCAATGVVDQLG